ncbi:poly-beta-1,6-N-acetyl-D-glucosamine biosynthesis protein PgaD [Lysobacter sp. A3-1-A15]|uniref:poly-beta-1,6-N-acetyl-D-glucosamine biosynthesis protein PgaD n=1 Tax=Novilysobacter viscosus TaxID=3098602 RepID=UPI002EDA55F5
MNTQVLIHSPHRQSTVQRSLYGTITLLAWAVYVYLVLPLITLLLWWLGLRGSYVQLWLPEAGFDRTLALTLPILAVVCALVLIGWAEFNRARFQNRERRLQNDDATPIEIADAMGAPHALAERLRGARVATLRLDQQALVTDIAVTQPLATPATTPGWG